MLANLNLKKVMFLDIETVPQWENYDRVPDAFKSLWDKKALNIAKEGQTPQDVFNRAGIYAEFGKIVCISMGVFDDRIGAKPFRVKSFYGDDEVDLLKAFAHTIQKYTSPKGGFLCAHNGKEFDFPYLSRRLIVNNLPLPSILDVAGKKPWEVPYLDTLEFWKFGDYKSYTSLHLLTTVLNIPTPKDDIDGSMVAEVYYIQKDLKRIAEYCSKDVVAIAQIMLRFKGEPILSKDDIEYLY